MKSRRDLVAPAVLGRQGYTEALEIRIMQRSFEWTRNLLEEIERQAPSGMTAPTYRSGTGIAADQMKFDLLAALFDHGFVNAAMTDAAGEREIQSVSLTADGRDLLDALRSDGKWTWIERRSKELGEPLTLTFVKAAIAESISGGFNA